MLSWPARASKSDDADLLAGSSHALVCDNAIDLGKEGIILSKPHIITGVDAGAPLSHQDVPRFYKLAGKSLHSQALPGAVSAISGTSRCFLVCHVLKSLMFPEGYR